LKAGRFTLRPGISASGNGGVPCAAVIDKCRVILDKKRRLEGVSQQGFAPFGDDRRGIDGMNNSLLPVHPYRLDRQAREAPREGPLEQHIE
jgi:hypothetical protein